MYLKSGKKGEQDLQLILPLLTSRDLDRLEARDSIRGGPAWVAGNPVFEPAPAASWGSWDGKQSWNWNLGTLVCYVDIPRGSSTLGRTRAPWKLSDGAAGDAEPRKLPLPGRAGTGPCRWCWGPCWLWESFLTWRGEEEYLSLRTPVHRPLQAESKVLFSKVSLP